MGFVRRHGGIILVLVLSIFSILPLFHSGFFPIHDNEQIARLFDLEQTLHFGNIPPRIAPNLGFGYGYPFFNFYPSFVYYVGELFRAIGFSFIDSTKLMIGLGFILSALSMYLFSKEFFGKIGGVISAAAYIYAPYQSVDVYVRGAFPEFWSFVFLPLIFLSYYKLSKKRSLKFFIMAVLSNSFLILTHNLIAFMAAFFILVWFVFLLYLSSGKKRFLITAILTALLSLAITGYFWIPSYFEKQYTMISLLTSDLASYKLHFVCVKQLFNSVWGYGGSLPDCNSGLSFEVGKVQLLLSLIALFTGFYLYRMKNKISLFIFIFAFLLLFSLFMTNIRSEFIWNLIQPMEYIQFPWRYLLFSAFFSSFLSGAITLVPFKKKLIFVFSAFAVLFLISTNFVYFRPQKYLTNAKDIDYIDTHKIRWDTSKLAAEYTPLGIATKKTEVNTIVNINEDEIAKGSFQVISGKIYAKTIVDKPQYKKFALSDTTDGIFRINTYTFPGWKIYLDGEEIKYSDNNKFKLITVNVPSGNHILEANFTDTLIRKIGNWMSIIGIIIFLTLVIKKSLIDGKS